jgi:hypothetical protein
VEANSTGGQGSHRAIVPRDDVLTPNIRQDWKHINFSQYTLTATQNLFTSANLILFISMVYNQM